MKVMILKGSKRNVASGKLRVIGKVWIERGRVMVDSHVPMAKDALRRLIDKRLQAGPVYRQGAKYLGQNDAPHTITHPRTPLKVTDPAFLDWLADERWFWEGEMLGAYQIDAFSCEVVDK